MRFYEYIPGNSIMHKFDPRVKLFWLIGFSALVFITTNPYIILGTLLFTLFLAVVGKLPFSLIWKSTRIFIIFLPIACIILYLILLGPKLEALTGGLLFTAKFLVLIFASVIFTMTTTARDLLLALTKLRVPYAFAFMLTIAIRFIPVISKEINTVINAQKARAYEVSFSLKRPIKSMERFFPILIPVLILLFKRAQELSLSIDSRAFRAKKKITYPKRLKFKTYDYFFSLVILGILVFVIWFLK